MINENLGKLVQHARDKKPTDFKEILTSEIDSRINTKVTEIRDGLSKNMFKMHENCEGHPDGVEHTHEDGTVHTHPGGDKEHTHENEESIHEEKISVATDAAEWKPEKEAKKLGLKAKLLKGKAKPGQHGFASSDPDRLELEGPEPKIQKFFRKFFGAEGGESMDDLQKDFGNDWKTYKSKKEGTLPPALQKAIDAKKKGKGDDEDKDDKEKDEGTLPPALQKAIDAKKKGKKDDDEEDEDDSPVGKKDENIANFGDKKAKAFTDDDNPTDNKKKKNKKEDIRAASRRILNKNPTGRK